MRIYKLDGLRGVFSVMIVLYHYLNYMPEYLRGHFFIRESYVFVDFFFVLSGFVISYNYHQLSDAKGFSVYIKKRLIRLYPLLFYTTTVYLCYLLFVNVGIKQYFPGLNHLISSTDAANIPSMLFKYMDTLFMTNATPLLGSTRGINDPSWSISAEMISYLVFGLISLTSIHKKRIWWLVTVTVLGILFCVYHGFYFYMEDFGFVRGLIAFNIGYLVWFCSRRPQYIPNYTEWIVPIFIVVILYYLHQLSGESQQIFGLITIPGFFGLSIWLLINTDGFLSRLLSTAPFIFLGKISYSLYLNHMLLVLTLPKLIFRGLGLEPTDLNKLGILILVIIICLVYSAITYEFIEKRLGSYLRKKWL